MNKERAFWGIHAGKTGDAEMIFRKTNGRRIKLLA
jgi:hypothetical protein